MLCCGYTLTNFPISIRLTSLALWQSNDCPSASKATLMNMDKYLMWIHYERLHNHNKAKHNKTVCIFLGIYCMIMEGRDMPVYAGAPYQIDYGLGRVMKNIMLWVTLLLKQAGRQALQSGISVISEGFAVASKRKSTASQKVFRPGQHTVQGRKNIAARHIHKWGSSRSGSRMVSSRRKTKDIFPINTELWRSLAQLTSEVTRHCMYAGSQALLP